MKKIIPFLLVCLMIIPLCCACSNDSSSNNSGDVNSGGDGYTGPEIKNWNGETVVVSANPTGGSTYSDIEVIATEQTGSHVNDASYQRYLKLQETYGINIEIEPRTPGTGDDELRTALIANTGDYDIIVNNVLKLAAWAGEGLLYDLKAVNSLDLSNSWWDQASYKDLSVNGHIFFVSGDLLVTDKAATWITFFNKELFQTYFPDEPTLYETVENNEWTIDKLNEYAKILGEGNASYGADAINKGTYGIIAQTYDGIACMQAFGQKMIDKDADDKFIANIDNEPTKTKFNHLLEVLLDTSSCVVAENSFTGGYPAIPDAADAVFQDGRALVQFNKLGYSQDLTEANLDFSFGVLPLPKYDTAQDKYYSPATVYSASFVSLPYYLGEDRLELVGYTLEVLGYWGQELLQPAYYDITIKSQKMHSQEDEDMLDVIFENRIWDPASVYNVEGTLYIYTGLIMNSSTGIQSEIESKLPAIEAALDTLVAQFDALED